MAVKNELLAVWQGSVKQFSSLYLLNTGWGNNVAYGNAKTEWV